MLAEYRPESPQQHETIFFSDLPATDAIVKIGLTLPSWRLETTETINPDYDFPLITHTFSRMTTEPDGITQEKLTFVETEGQIRTAKLELLEETSHANNHFIYPRDIKLDQVIHASLAFSPQQVIIYGRPSDRPIKINGGGNSIKSLLSSAK